jgi:hypothetical protein
VRVELSEDELRLLMEACRAVATRHVRSADYERNPVIRRVMIDAGAELDALAARLQASDRAGRDRFKPDLDLIASNVRPLRNG